ncbi:TRAP transporter large permease [Cohaesibacter gelatinilyticus]|uniref:TRAP transporter large permease protein n=1 Tax=Cohaesibacter gelatinilyticus TaxID=372072 RepID=A0A285NJW0_9HYPH|nr:TRAP transporter large permease [Cohaesibacter gelatinilyticus]SNZ09247.1 TRAP transporter, DctM subunit [Cohaesibacter gelatinilyticus]
MAVELIGSLGFLALFGLLASGMPVAMALTLVGFIGTAIMSGISAAAYTLSGQVFATVTVYELSIIPLFILMGNLASAAGLSRDLFNAAYKIIGHLRGGLATATILGCAGFAALSGSSIASAITMGKVSYPEMRRHNYGARLATGAIAAGGTLGILIPPSTGFVIYAVLTEESIGRLFIAGVLPGLLLTGCFILAILVITFIWPEEGPRGPSFDRNEKFRSLVQAGGITTIIMITIGGIYTGFFTPVEASGVGAFFALFMLIIRRKCNLRVLYDVGAESLRTTGMVFFILIGANVFAPFVALSHLPETIAGAVTDLSLGAYGTLTIILLGYVILGMFIEGLSLLVITLPIVFPLITGLGFDPIWLGVVMVIVLEMGLISPPIGVNVFIVKSVVPDVKIETIFAGIMPFWIAMIVTLTLLVFMPEIALLLPNAMFSN